MNKITPNLQYTGYSPKNNIVKKDNPGFFKKLGAGIVGCYIAKVATNTIMSPTSFFVQKGMSKLNKTVNRDDIKLLNQAGDTIFNQSGLAQKGVSIIKGLTDLDKLFLKILKNQYRKIAQALDSKMGKNLGSKFVRKINKIIKPNLRQFQLLLGKNAFFNPATNQIQYTNKISLAQFHELGHAMNFNNKGLGKFICNLRPDNIYAYGISKLLGRKFTFPILALMVYAANKAILLTAIFKNKKAEGEKPQGFFDKTTTFIKDNVGKLAFVLALPVLCEENLATIRGEKAVKNLIRPDLFKKVKLQNRLGLLSYSASATLTGIGMYLTSKIRDKIVQPNLNKN